MVFNGIRRDSLGSVQICWYLLEFDCICRD